MSPFHLAIRVHDLTAARAFYATRLGCKEGRSSDDWIDFDFFGHQLVCHLDREAMQPASTAARVDGESVPVPHFGVVLDMESWRTLAGRLRDEDFEFLLEPQIRFRGMPGEQATVFFRDPSGNAIEIKGFADVAGQLFAT